MNVIAATIPDNRPINIMIVGDHASKDDTVMWQPFSATGQQGKILNQLLAQAGINRHTCAITYVIKDAPHVHFGMKDYFLDSALTLPNERGKAHIDELQMLIESIKPNIVIAMGPLATYHLCGLHGLDAHRGTVMLSTLVKDQKVLATFSPSRVMFEWSALFPVVADLRKALRESNTRVYNEVHRTVRLNPTVNEFVEYVEEIMAAKGYAAIDIETTRGDLYITHFGVARSATDAMSLCLARNGISQFNEQEETLIWQTINRFLSCKDVKFILQNASFDCSVLYKKHGILIHEVWMDTLIAAHVCWYGQPKDLGFLASICLNIPSWKHTASADIDTYNALDCTSTFGIAMVMKDELRRAGTYDTYKMEMTQLPVAMLLSLQGINIDVDEMNRLIAHYTQELKCSKEKLDEATGNPSINYNSHQQVNKLLYGALGMPVQYKRRKSITDERKATTDDSALQKLAITSSSPVPTLLLAYRENQKILSSFLSFDIDENKKVYTSYNITGTETGRWSSSSSIVLPYGSGNLQNIPHDVRSMYLPPEGKVFVQADYKLAEAVVMAYLCNDEMLIDVIKRGDDVHKLTASLMFKKPVDMIAKDERQIGKTCRHSLNYWAGPGVLAQKMKCSLSEAKKLRDIYYKAFPSLLRYYERVQSDLRATRTLTNLVGRKRVFYERWGDELFRSAYAFLPQSTVGDLLNMSLVDFYNNHGDQYDIILQLHDAIYTACYPHEVDDCKKKMAEAMTRPLIVNGREMIIEVEFKVGKNWGDLE